MRVVKWELVWMFKILMGLCRGCGKIWSWHAFRMVYMQMADANWVVYWVTFWWSGGNA